MKLRQKLAVVLASAMVVSAVPVVTSAATTNSLTKETLKVKKEVGFYNVATANALKVKFTDHTDGDEEVFYLDLDNATWDEGVLADAADNEGWDKAGTAYEFDDNGATITYERQNDTTMKVTVTGIDVDDPVVKLPLTVKTKDGDAKVSIVTKGGTTTVSQGTFVFATTADKKMSITIGDAKTFYSNGAFPDITLDEAYKGALADGGQFTIELDDPDFYFVEGTCEVEGKYGFSYLGVSKVTVEVDSKDSGKAVIKLPKTGEAVTAGTFIVKGIEVKSTNRKPETGDFVADFKGDDLVAEKTGVKVATISDYGIYMKVKDDKAKDVKAGRNEEVEFEVGENVENSMISAREFDVTLDKAHWDYKGLVKSILGGDFEEEDFESNDDYLKAAAKLDPEDLANAILDNEGDFDGCEAAFDQDRDGKAIPQTIIFTVGDDKDGKAVQDNDNCDKLKFKTKISVPVGLKDEESITVKVSGRALENDVEGTVINIVNPFNIEYTPAALKTGLQGQVSGEVTLTETEKDCLQRGDISFRMTKDNEYFDIYLTDAAVEVSDGLKGTKTDVTKGNAKSAKIKVDLNRVSKEAATVTFKDLKFTTSRTVPEGTYDLEMFGTALDVDSDLGGDHKIIIKDFIKITTTNTQDITANGLAKGTAQFVIGESKYMLNGEEVTMDAPSYIQDPGYTMVPARYVAEAFGVEETDILFNNGVVTIFAGERTINLKTGSNVAVVNGNSIEMGAAVVNKDGRTYIPAGQLAGLLGITTSWDATTKTATFENK